MSRSRPGCMNETSTGAATGAKPTPAAGPTPAAIQSATPTAAAVLSSEDPKMRRGGCNMRHKRILHKMPILSALPLAGGRMCRYNGRAPRGSLTSRPITGKHCGSGRPKAALLNTFCNATQTWDHTLGHSMQNGRKLQRAAPIAQCHRQHA